ncbi:GLPGLI family protein [uncultured Polaribacter sp.]|uniref:GLPGLI family protein n=1 Tax=uncultured Polaribacter sp. TaxID=174711 RepID=UPI0030DC39B3|tara:strand:- start:15 stop:854 length:840 start_codon:yes stop_codon:yes gene_type:complete
MKSLFTILFALVTITTFAQKDFQGKAIYMSKSTIDFDSFGGRGGGQMSEARKKEIADRMKTMLEKTFILSFDKTASLYKEDERLAAPTAGESSRFMGMMGGNSIKYKNTKDLIALEETEFFGKKFLVSDAMETPNWELGSETKQIGNYVCFKATMMQDVNPTDFINMRRGGREDDKKEQEKVETPQIEVVAWYTPQIPVNNGPGEYWGLPGLILEVNAGRTTILCTEIVLNPSEKQVIDAPTKGKEITREKYNETVKIKTEEMRQNFQGRGNGGGGRRQ